MNWIIWASAYAVVCLAFFARISFVTKRTLNEWKEKDYNIKFYTLLPRIVRDSFSWPIYIIWFGVKQVFGELR